MATRSTRLLRLLSRPQAGGREPSVLLRRQPAQARRAAAAPATPPSAKPSAKPQPTVSPTAATPPSAKPQPTVKPAATPSSAAPATPPSAKPQPTVPPAATPGSGLPAVLALGAAGILVAGGAIYALRGRQAAEPAPAAAPKKAKEVKEEGKKAKASKEEKAKEAPAPAAVAEPVVKEAAPPAPDPAELAAAAAASAAAAEAAAAKAAAEAAQAAAEAAALKAAAEAQAAAEAKVSGAARSSLEAVDASRKVGKEKLRAALRALKDANAARDPAAIEEALEAASKLGLGLCSEVCFAQSIVGPARKVRESLGMDLDELLGLPQEFRGLTEEEALAAEGANCARMSREELQGRIAELSRYLATSRVHASARIEEVLQTRLEAADATSIRDLREAVARADQEYDEDTAKALVTYREELQQQREDAIAGAIAQAEAEGQQRFEEERARLVKCAHEYNDLLSSVVGLEDAIVAGRSAEAELEALRAAAAKADPFSAELLAQLPQSSVEICQRKAPFPTALYLRRHLASEISDMAAAALAPPDGGFLGELLGRVFRWFYILHPEAIPLPPPGGRIGEAELKLQALGLALPTGLDEASQREKLETSFKRLEGTLQGLSRERAVGWMEEARAALVLRQTIWAVKARVQSLNATSL